jgi:dGTPase
VVQFADKIAYINHDIQDSIRAGVISESDLPKDCIKYYSTTPSRRLNRMVSDIIYSSQNKPKITMSEEGWAYTTRLREWMFENYVKFALRKWARGLVRPCRTVVNYIR